MECGQRGPSLAGVISGHQFRTPVQRKMRLCRSCKGICCTAGLYSAGMSQSAKLALKRNVARKRKDIPRVIWRSGPRRSKGFSSPVGKLSSSSGGANVVRMTTWVMCAPPLLLLSLPTGLLNPLLRRGPLRQMTRGMSFLFLATFLFNANFALWLIPALYNPAVQQMPLHDLQSLIFLCTGVLNWWPLITPASEGPRWPHSIQLLYLFLDGIPLGFVCVILFFINQPAYAAYTSAPHLWGISALADFQLGAIILYAPGLLLDIVVLSIIFFKWLARQEEVARQREEAEDAAAAAEEAELAQSQQAAQQA